MVIHNSSGDVSIDFENRPGRGDGDYQIRQGFSSRSSAFFLDRTTSSSYIGHNHQRQYVLNSSPYRGGTSMKVTTILGSPKKKGNTATVLGAFEELISQRHEVERIDIADYNIKGCLGCAACKKVPDEPGCVQKDDAVALFERMMEADVIIYATPLYSWGFSAQLKSLIDRHFCLVKDYGTPQYTSLIEDKRTVLLVTCAGPVEDNADLIQEIFTRMNDYLKGSVVGKYIVPFCTTPDAIGEKAMETAKKMAGDIEGA
jgi:multimeric flavodoxin WrbA